MEGGDGNKGFRKMRGCVRSFSDVWIFLSMTAVNSDYSSSSGTESTAELS